MRSSPDSKNKDIIFKIRGYIVKSLLLAFNPSTIKPIMSLTQCESQSNFFKIA